VNLAKAGTRALRPEQIAEIRQRYADGFVFQRELAEEYRVSRPLISQICHDITPVPRECPSCYRGSGHDVGHAGAHVRSSARSRAVVARKQYPHGTNARYHLGRCRCAPCKAAARVYANNRNRLTAYGRFDVRVSAHPARAHLRKLADAGVGPKRASRTCGVAASTLARIMGTRTGSGGRWVMAGYRPIKTLRQSTVDRILAMTLSEARGPGNRMTLEESALARRRVAELIDHGVTRWRIAVAINPSMRRHVRRGSRPGLQLLNRQGCVTRKTYDAIGRLYLEFFRARRMATPEEQREAA
jgi:hypothetical protein